MQGNGKFMFELYTFRKNGVLSCLIATCGVLLRQAGSYFSKLVFLQTLVNFRNLYINFNIAYRIFIEEYMSIPKTNDHQVNSEKF